MRKAILALGTVMVLTTPSAAEEDRIKFPAGYQQKFINYLNLDRFQNDDQIIHLYANKTAVDGVKATGEFPNGSILIGEVYKAKKDADGEVIESLLGQRIRGDLALIAVMEKQDGWGDDFSEDLKNGDWDFAAFKPDGSRAKKDLNACRACHAAMADVKHVFSYEHLQ